MATRNKAAPSGMPRLDFTRELNLYYILLAVTLRFSEWRLGVRDPMEGMSSLAAGTYMGACIPVVFGIWWLVRKHFSDGRKVRNWSWLYRVACLANTALVVIGTTFAMCVGLAGFLGDLQADGYNPFTTKPSQDELLAYFCDAVFGLLTSHFADLMPIFKTNLEVNLHTHYLFAAFMVAFKLFVHLWLALTLFVVGKKLFGSGMRSRSY